MMKLDDVKAHIPKKAQPAVRAIFKRHLKFFCRCVDLRDRLRSAGVGVPALPPACLRYRVTGSLDAEQFLAAGERNKEDIEAALEKGGRSFGDFRDVLDFGCGCGRTLLRFEDHLRAGRLYGTDTDAEAIRWCRDNLPYAAFSVNGILPPLEYLPGSFDFVYAISVFTHLDEQAQFRWLDELGRVTKPGGVVLLTVHGQHARGVLPQNDVADIERDGFKFVVSNDMQGVFPEWYQNAFHTREYVLDRYSEYLDILAYVPRGMTGHQDVVVLGKR